MRYYWTLIIAVFLLGPLSSVKGTDFKPFERISELESNLKDATNNEGYLVIKKSDWEKFKTSLLSDLYAVEKKDDSLSIILTKQADTLSLLKKSKTLVTVKAENDVYTTTLNLAVNILFFLILLTLLFKYFQRNKMFKEGALYSRHLEEQYQNSKRYWINQERKLKRELIDIQQELDELHVKKEMSDGKILKNRKK